MSILKETTEVLGHLLEVMPSDNLFVIREEAASFLREKGIPSKRHEDWKYTNVKRLFDNGVSPATSAPSLVPRPSSLAPDAPTVRLINSSVGSDFPTLEGVTFLTLADGGNLLHNIGKSGIHTNQELAALNTALFTDALIIHVKKNAQPAQSLLIDHGISATDSELFNSRILIVLEDGAKLNCVHHFHGEAIADSSLVNHVTEAFIGANASLELNFLQEIGTGNLVNTTEVNVERDGRFTTNTVQLSGKLIRNNTNVRIAGQNAEAHLNGFYMIDGNDLYDNHTLVDHLVPNCQSNETYKGLLSGKATGVFNGKVHVHRDAQKTNAYQQNKNILLSDTATMNSKPELEIYADDVKCSHGSTTGQLDEDAVFYLRSRGLSHKGAIALLLTAFASDVLEQVSDEGLRTVLGNKVQERLAGME
jgi:Fe-S cluster assembly protein SufD